MKKSIVVSLLAMFLLTGCISGLAVSEDVKDPAVKVEDIEIKDWADVASEPGNEILDYAIVNNSKYTITYFYAEGNTSNGTEGFDLLVDETLLPGERSTNQTTPGVNNMDKVKLTAYNYTYIDKEDDKYVHVQYDAKLDKYEALKNDDEN
ncbi:MAG: hypothetical protein ACLVKW_06460 [Fenollaria massiliensis]